MRSPDRRCLLAACGLTPTLQKVLGITSMLTLTRHRGESIFIGDDIEVLVLGIDEYGQVELGFLAPQEVKILRDEIAVRITTIDGSSANEM